jgi:hypothetical protein
MSTNEIEHKGYFDNFTEEEFIYDLLMHQNFFTKPESFN